MMKQERKLALQHRDRLKRMEVDKNAYLSKLKSQRFSSYKVSGGEIFRILCEIIIFPFINFFASCTCRRKNWNNSKKN